ncbi:MAG: hypothetical protein OXQ31_23095 [Spirochaetaceae bacterium]|nr:hypothetical protein [Spirochaetaceae bacterium]
MAVYEREADEARADPGLLRQFRAFRLNQGTRTNDVDLLIDADAWRQSEGQAGAIGPWLLGVDLGGGLAMSAACGYWPTTGRLEAVAAIPGDPDVVERGTADGVGDLYGRMVERGELVTTPGRAPDYAALLADVVKRWGRPVAVVADRYRERDLHDAMADAGIAAPFVPRGQGYVDGAADVREFRRAVVGGDVTPVPSLLLRHALSGAVVVSDQSGNAKLAKASEGNRRQRHRDDAAAAAVLAVSEGRRRARLPQRPAWRLAGVA